MMGRVNLRSFLLAGLALAGCGGSSSGKASGDPRFSTSPNAIAGEYLAVFATGAYKEPTGGDDGNATSVATTVCAQYGATLNAAYAYAGIFSFAATETQARAMSHDARVTSVESDVTGTIAAKR